MALLALAFIPFTLAYRPDEVRWGMAAASGGMAFIVTLYWLALWLRPRRLMMEAGGPALFFSVIGLTAINAAAGEQPAGIVYIGVIVLAAGAVLVHWWQMWLITAFALACGVWDWNQGSRDEIWFEMGVATLVAIVAGLIAFHARLRAVLASYELRQEEMEARLRYERAVAASASALWEYLPEQNALTLAPSWIRMLGYRPSEIGVGLQGWTGRVHPDDRVALEQALARQLEPDAPALSVEHRLRRADGSYLWMLVSGRSSVDLAGRLWVTGAFIDIDRRKQLEARLQHEAHHDRLTGLANRRLLMQTLSHSFAVAARHPERTFALAFFDLDGFKAINDKWGHAAGDHILWLTAERLRRTSRSEDLVARLGGDEIVALLQNVDSLADAHKLAERLKNEIELPIDLPNARVVQVGSSYGLAWSGDGFVAGEEMLRAADTAMYTAKRARKSSVGGGPQGESAPSSGMAVGVDAGT